MAIRERIQKLTEREDKLFAHRDGIEEKMNEVLGIKLTSSQLLQIRQLANEFDRCEQAIENLQETVLELRQAINA